MRDRHRKHANPFTVRELQEKPKWDDLFGRTAPLAVDIGFGRGRFTVELGTRHPEWNVVGLEIREHLVEILRASAQEAELANVYGLLANANMHLQDLFAPKSIQFVSVNFPDPWFKKRHHKRRVISHQWLNDLCPLLQPEAELHVMSDFEPLAVEALELLNHDQRFENMTSQGGFSPQSTTGIVTEREIKHESRGDPIFRMAFRYVNTLA